MLDWTDRPCRFFERLLTRRGRLYTEMVTTGAIRFGSRDALLGNSRVAGPTALRLSVTARAEGEFWRLSDA